MPKILVVEDAEEMRNLLRNYLERMLKYEVIEACDGLEGIKMAQLHQPDAIILDLMMPVANGDLALGYIRSTAALRHTPVIVSSAHPNAHQLSKQLGADTCLAKPFDLFTLKTTIENLLARGSSAPVDLAPPAPASSTSQV